MQIKLKWLGTAAYVLSLNDTRLLFDPFFFRNEESSPVLKTKREELEQIDAVFITHAHIDHVTDAAWFAENRNVPVYTSEVGKKNMIKWCEGEIIDFETYGFNFQAKPYSLTEKGKNNIHPITAQDHLKINEEVDVDAIKSEHVKFDFNTIWARLKSWDFWKNIKNIAPLGKDLPMGEVFGYCTNYKDKKIVGFGSLYHKYGDELDKYADADVFIAPLAGNSAKHIAEKSCKMIDHLRPKIVVPVHWDNFFPPISRLEDLDPFFEKMEKEYPEIQVFMPKMDEEIELPL
ncbi:MAG: MBL fold metallo-hydrolase [Promethearchaeia archaeon]